MSMIVRNRDMNTTPFMIHANGCANEGIWKHLVSEWEIKKGSVQYGCPSDLTFITWNTKEEQSLLGRSLSNMGVDYICMGKDVQDWCLHQVTLTISALHAVDTKYVVGMDAFDVIMLGDPHRMLDCFKRCYGGAKLVYGAEKNYWPGVMGDKEVEDRRAPPWTDYKYLNSGAFIGEREFMLDFYEKTKVLMDEWVKGPEVFKNGEQGLTHMAFQKYGAGDDITLDYGCRMFQQLFQVRLEELDVLHASSGTRTQLVA